MNKRKTLAEQANRFMQEDYLTAPQPSTEFDPFAPNYGGSQKQVKLSVDDEKKPMEKDINKTEPKTLDGDKEVKGNKSYVQKVYIELSEMFKDVVAKSKDIDSKLDEVTKSVDSASDDHVVELEGVSKQLHDDVEKFAVLTKSILEILNTIEDEEIEEKEPEDKISDDDDEESNEKDEEPETDTEE